MQDDEDEFVAPEAPGQFSADIENANKYLKECGWPAGLIKGIGKSFDEDITRFFIIDNSGSMSSDDGSRVVLSGSQKKFDLFDMSIYCFIFLIE